MTDSGIHSEAYLKWLDKMGHARPAFHPHGTDDEIRSNMKQLKPTNWRQEGNELIADTELGPLINYLPTDMILTGVDEQGLPILQKIKL